MGVPIESLSPWAQQQAVRKLAEQQRQKQAAAEREKASKYHNQRDERPTPEGKPLKFHSKKEARRYDELMVMLRAGKIRDLKLQPQFTLQEAYTTPEGVRVRAIRYTADFSYYEPTNKGADGSHAAYWADQGGGLWVKVVEDVKSRVTRTTDYQMRKKLMQERFHIDIKEI